MVKNLYKEKYDVYIGRGKGLFNDPLKCSPGQNGWLGNPISKDKKCLICSHIHNTPGDTLICYEKYLVSRLKEEKFKEAFLKLKGKTLGCFCKPKPCHGDIIVKILEKLYI